MPRTFLRPPNSLKAKWNPIFKDQNGRELFEKANDYLKLTIIRHHEDKHGWQTLTLKI